MKTPPTTLRAYPDVLSEHPERLSQISPAAGRQIERMEQVIAGLLQMAYLSAGTDIALHAADLYTVIPGLEPVCVALAAKSGHS